MRHLRWILGAWVLAAAVAEAAQPNLVLILADDVGREAVGAYGGSSYATPQLDRLAREGLRLDSFYACPVCHPTRVALMSGRHLSTMGNPQWGYYPGGKAEQQTVMQELKKAGYATAMAGKYHLAMLKNDPEHPHRLGIDEYCFFGWHEGPRYWQPHVWQNGQLRDDVGDRYGPDVYSEFLIDFITRNRDRPFFAFYSMTLCHAVSNDFLPRPPHGPDGRYEEFGEMIANMDKQIGRLIDALDEAGVRQNTLVLFIADNGSPGRVFAGHQGEKLIDGPAILSMINGRQIPGAKGKWTDWGIRVPAIANWPGTIEPGRISDGLTEVSDILPTFCDLAGVSPAYAVDGESFAGLLTGRGETGRDWIMVQTKEGVCVRNRHWKLLSNGLLYDMENDPDEKTPIAPGSESPAAKAARAQLKPILDRQKAKL